MKKILMACMAVVLFFMGVNAQNVIPFYPEGESGPVGRYEPIPQVVTQPTAPCITNTNLVIVNPLGRAVGTIPAPYNPTPDVYRGGGRKVWNTPKPAPAHSPNCCSQIWDIRREMDDMDNRIWKLEHPPVVPPTDPNFDAGKDDGVTAGITPPQGGNGTPDWLRELPWWLLAALIVGLAIWFLRWLFINPPTAWRSPYGSKESRHDRYEEVISTKPATPTAADDVKIIEALAKSGGYYHRYADGATKINVPTPAKEEAQKPASEPPAKKSGEKPNQPVEGKDALTQAE